MNMDHKRFHSVGGLLAICVAMLWAAPALAGSWWSPEYGYRRSVTVDSAKASGLPGDDVATFAMPTGGLTKADGSDIRVATAEGVERPVQVLMTGPGDRVSVAFAVSPNVTNYHVYFGNAKPSIPARKLEIRRGVLLEMWSHRGRVAATLDEAQRMLDRSGQMYGRGFRDQIFLGHNPFTGDEKVLSIFTGYLQCIKSGQYTFATTSRDSSFLLVDDHLVVEHGGQREPSGQSPVTGKVELKAGLHKVTYYHLNRRNDPICVAAWQPPGAARVWPIEPEAFGPVPAAKVGAMEQFGRPLSVDFIPEHLGETFVMNGYSERLAFKALAMPAAPKNVQWRWDFGDGQTSNLAEVEHVYLTAGDYVVTLTAKTAMGELKRANRIHVDRPWDHITLTVLDSKAQQAAIVKEYDFTRLSGEGVGMAMVLLDRAKMPEAMARACEALVAKDGLSAEVLEVAMPLYTQAMLNEGQPAKAAAGMLKAARSAKDASMKASMTVEAGKLLVASGGREELDRATGLFEEVIRKYESATAGPAVRGAKIGIGDVWRARGNCDKALDAYRKAGVAGGNEAAGGTIARGDYARHVESYLRSGDLVAAGDYLDRWEESFPVDKLEGYTSLLRARLCVAQMRLPAAVAEAGTLVGANPTSYYAPQLLMLQSEVYEKMNKGDKANESLKRIVEDYKESPLAAQAAKKLGSKS